MFLDPFYTPDQTCIRISAQQGSRFAKEIAGDFNPIHDPHSKRFCVPGDLLFALVLSKCGLSRQMNFTFKGMVEADTALDFPATTADAFSIRSLTGKTYLDATRSGETTHDARMIETLVRRYVAFSGQTFPHILVPLMQKEQVMLNPDRPLVIYESMSFDLERLDIPDFRLELVDTHLEVKGKRGKAKLNYQFTSANRKIGRGQKKLVLSGLREYQQDAVQELVARYAGWKTAYGAA